MRAAVVGAGLAGCEAALQLADAGVPVELIEQKPERRSPAHHSDLFAELVCSNSLKAARVDSAAGLLKEEMRRLGSVCMQAADRCAVAAGGALAVDRTRFAQEVTRRVCAHPQITVTHREQRGLPEADAVVVATGPLTDGAFAETLRDLCGADFLSFYDAAAPIVTAESVDFSHAFSASRYGRGGEDYVNCPLNKEEYERFYEALVSAERAPLHEFDGPDGGAERPAVYEGCMPIEIMARRGPDTIRFGPMKPVGLRDPATGHRPWAVVQLRRENAEGTLYNLVGFQTNLKFSEQKRVFSLIPALREAQFARFGVMHRNTFLDAPRLLTPVLSLKRDSHVFFAGQITGTEGYMESAAGGILAGRNAARLLRGREPLRLPEFTMLGALIGYVTDETVKDFQPMGANFGILPALPERIRDKRARYAALAARSLDWFTQNADLLGI